MFQNQRQEEILNILSRLRQISVTELTGRLKVSEVTIRKDLCYLEEQGRVLRTRGGAELAQDSRLLRNITVRRSEHLDRKTAIAEKAAILIREGDTVYIDAGSTCMFLCPFIADKCLRVVTNSIDVMNRLGDYPEISLTAVGGTYRREAGTFIGPTALDTVRKYHFDTCFMGATGFTQDGHFSSQNTIESQLKELVIKSSGRRVMLCDSTKYGKSAFSVFAGYGDIDILVTDQGFKDSRLFIHEGVEVVICTF